MISLYRIFIDCYIFIFSLELLSNIHGRKLKRFKVNLWETPSFIMKPLWSREEKANVCAKFKLVSH